MTIKKIALLGGRGHVGQELLRLIASHEIFTISSVYSSSQAGKIVDDHLYGNLLFQNLSLECIDLIDVDAYILALPNDQSEPYVELINTHNPDAKIIDISADHRFDGSWEYRIPELSQSHNNSRISNPGCYASAMQFMLAPINNKIVDTVNFFGISGYSGAGASLNARNNPQNLKNNIIPYSMISHLQEKEVQAHADVPVFFTPHVANFFRGILITGNFILSDKLSVKDVIELYDDFYHYKDLIQIQRTPPFISDVQNTSNVILGGFDIDFNFNRLTFCCVLDNLLKGAATQATQNLNSAFGLNDNHGIIT